MVQVCFTTVFHPLDGCRIPVQQHWLRQEKTVLKEETKKD